MFRVPHYEYHVEEWKDLKDDFLSSLHVKSPENIPSGADYSVTTSYWDEFDYRDWLPFLEMVKPYISRIPSTETVTRVWYQTAQQYDYHTAHTHGSVGWSAVFYAHFNPEVHEATKFYCPFTNIMGDVELYCPMSEVTCCLPAYFMSTTKQKHRRTNNYFIQSSIVRGSSAVEPILPS